MSFFNIFVKILHEIRFIDKRSNVKKIGNILFISVSFHSFLSKCTTNFSAFVVIIFIWNRVVLHYWKQKNYHWLLCWFHCQQFPIFAQPTRPHSRPYIRVTPFEWQVGSHMTKLAKIGSLITETVLFSLAWN